MWHIEEKTPSFYNRWVTVQRRHGEWEVSETLPGIKGLMSVYHSINMFYVLISTDGELEYLKPMEKALRSEEVTIISNYVFFQEVK